MTTPEDETTYVKYPDEAEPREVRVLDLIDPTAPRASSQVRSARMLTCKGCDRFQFWTICGECGCAMQLKTWLAEATCPLDRWEA